MTLVSGDWVLGPVGLPAMAGISTFNIQDGFCEALVRGYRSGFLKDSDYAAICGSETLEGAWASAPLGAVRAHPAAAHKRLQHHAPRASLSAPSHPHTHTPVPLLACAWFLSLAPVLPSHSRHHHPPLLLLLQT